ncbi:hypothetical protein [Algivirga pacifica]|uniref:Uncharacterized protein n=1 Tax=Algivirga pacifica TaxID=1162670 RepID=A0ABP9D4W1_9BACT
MRLVKIFGLLYSLLLLGYGCTTDPKHSQETQAVKGTEDHGIIGYYVSADYDKRQAGYDWVAVRVMQKDSTSLKVSVRSRADRKKPTCTFDAPIFPIEDSLYEARVNDKTILFHFTKEQLTIDAKEKGDEEILQFYCSGGGTIGGQYTKLQEPIDSTQIDQTQFSKHLNLQGVDFNVKSLSKEGVQQLEIMTAGLPNSFQETMAIENQEVVAAEVEDLNSDGSPELLVFTVAKGPNEEAMVYAFSVNNGQSMSSVYFEPTKQNMKVNEGYEGHDEFAVVENRLVQRFPIYNQGKLTGTIKQISYRLKDGESSRMFVVDQVVEYEVE